MYQKLDLCIMDAVTNNRHPYRDDDVIREADRIAAETGREALRVIDGRLQALRRKKRIQWLIKKKADDRCDGWRLVVA